MGINEVGRAVVELGDPSCMGLGCHQLWIAIDQVEQGRKATLIAGPTYSYSAMGGLCEDRACDTVDGSVKVNGKPIKAENYIKLWRQALAAPYSAQQAVDVLGLQVKLMIRGNLPKQAGKKRQRTDDPMGGFNGWAAKYAGPGMPTDADGYFTVTLDLTDAQAWQAWEFMRGYADYNDKDPRNQHEVVVTLAEGSGEQTCKEAAGVPAGDREQEALFN